MSKKGDLIQNYNLLSCSLLLKRERERRDLMASSLQHQQHITAANQLSEQSQRGTLGLAYRKSVMSLQSLFGWKSSSGNTSQAEREPLLDDQDGATAGPSYGSVLDLPPERRVPKPKIVKSPVRVEAKVWFANEVGCQFQEKSALSLSLLRKIY